MKTLMRFGAVGMLLVTVAPLAAQQGRTVVTLTVIHNGHQKPAPAEVTVSFGGRSLRIPVRKGKFEVPAEVVAAKRVTFEADVEGSHIRITKLAGSDFAARSWTLRLAERADDEYYDWPGPKGADIPTSCMLEFDSGHEDPARGLFEEHCRSKKE